MCSDQEKKALSYKEVQDAQALIPLFEACLENYNSVAKTPMDRIIRICC